MSVPDENYSRNMSCTLISIFTFLQVEHWRKKKQAPPIKNQCGHHIYWK